MTEKEYRDSAGISRSELWLLHTNPEKFKYYKEHPEPSTPTLMFGAAVHKLLLEPETFDKEFVVMPHFDRRTKAGKEAYNKFTAISEGRNIITIDDYQKAAEMAQTALKEYHVQTLLSGEREKPFMWIDDSTGELCKIRVDAVLGKSSPLMVIDYKTTNDASMDAFLKSVLNYGYDFQAGMYCEGVAQNMGEFPMFIFIAQEKNPPYSVNIMRLDDDFLARGHKIFRRLLDEYHYCKESGDWYGYLGKDGGNIKTLSLPAWAKI